MGISDRILNLITDSYEKRIPIDDYIHSQLLYAFCLYLITDGMPAAINMYLSTENIERVQKVQQDMLRLYHQDFAKYEKGNKVMTTSSAGGLRKSLRDPFSVSPKGEV